MKKILIILFLFLSACGYQPIYINTNLDNFEFSKINIEGENDINKKLLSSLMLKENISNINLPELSLKSYFEVEETSKNTKGQIETYRSKILVNLTISENNDIIKNKVFSDQFSYNRKNNKFELIEYQADIKNQLISKITEDIILFLNMK